jgi:hypothetical protein
MHENEASLLVRTTGKQTGALWRFGDFDRRRTFRLDGNIFLFINRLSVNFCHFT